LPLDRPLRERRRTLLERDRVDRPDPRQASFERQLEAGREYRRLGHELSLVPGRAPTIPGATLIRMRRSVGAIAVVAAVAAVTAVTASVKPGSANSKPALGLGDTAETVMGTLVGPPNPRFLQRIRNGKMGGVVLLRNGWLTQGTATAV